MLEGITKPHLGSSPSIEKHPLAVLSLNFVKLLVAHLMQFFLMNYQIQATYYKYDNISYSAAIIMVKHRLHFQLTKNATISPS